MGIDTSPEALDRMANELFGSMGTLQVQEALRALAEEKRRGFLGITDNFCEIALDAFYGQEDWRKDYRGEEFKPISSMREALTAVARGIQSQDVQELLSAAWEFHCYCTNRWAVRLELDRESLPWIRFEEKLNAYYGSPRSKGRGEK